MKRKNLKTTLKNFTRIYSAARESNDGSRCMIAPHPDLRKQINEAITKLKASTKTSILANKIRFQEPARIGLNDGLVHPGDMFGLGTSATVARSPQIDKAPLRGTLRVIVVLVEFADKAMTQTKKHFEDLFFSTGVIPTGSVNEYYKEVTGGLIDIKGQVVGPFKLPKTLAQYAHGASGMGPTAPNARTMAKDAAVKANPSINFSLYDNDGDNFVDAFVVVHAGTGAETNNNPGDIWSHKWVLSGGAYAADAATKVYSYLTVPEDCKLGVCAHELGHLLFRFPDLYDTDYSSEGIGDWCLMAGGSWNNSGLTPAHPSAWCKCNQGWTSVVVPTSNQTQVSIPDVKTGLKVFKLWKNGTPSKEYFLVENRQKTKFDKYLPGSGLLVWHIDDNLSENSDEAHYKVALLQADGLKQLESATNQGDAADVFPGSANKKSITKSTTPNTLSYGGVDTFVSLKRISASAATMSADIAVT